MLFRKRQTDRESKTDRKKEKAEIDEDNNTERIVLRRIEGRTFHKESEKK